jgi:hypothetical protein
MSNKLSAFRFFALPLLLAVAFLLGYVSPISAQERVATHPVMPAVTTACGETGLIGAPLQENKLFCNPAPVIYGTCPPTSVMDGNIVYTAAIGAANKHVMVGEVLSCAPSNDWSGLPINYVSFSNGNFHAEFHGDNVVRIYDTSGGRNAQVYP